MREIIVDIETTGLRHNQGDRIVEIAALEINDLLPTGEIFHEYVNPQTSISQTAQEIHGLSQEFLKDKPIFKQIIKGFLKFIKQDPLVIHNASFDMGFIQAEMKRIKLPQILNNQVVDTLHIARKKFPNLSNSLDSLCTRYKIDNSKRKIHSATLDCKLLAKVYLQLKGGKQQDFIKTTQEIQIKTTTKTQADKQYIQNKIYDYQFKIIKATQSENEKHQQLIEEMKKQNIVPIWDEYKN